MTPGGLERQLAEMTSAEQLELARKAAAFLGLEGARILATDLENATDEALTVEARARRVATSTGSAGEWEAYAAACKATAAMRARAGWARLAADELDPDNDD